jgi:putative ABC transport system ATP-binding protein
LIRLEGVKKVFYTDEVETHALEGTNLDIQTGEFVSITGPSGCGKSTLLSILGLLDSPTEGNYWLNGKPVATLSARERALIRNQEVGFIFQSFNLIGDLTVYENVELPLTYRGMSAAERRTRVGVARAVAGKPVILLADEPTGNLDSSNGEAVMTLLHELHCNGSTICMVTHDTRYARFSDRAIHLFDGRVVSEAEINLGEAELNGKAATVGEVA